MSKQICKSLVSFQKWLIAFYRHHSTSSAEVVVNKSGYIRSIHCPCTFFIEQMNMRDQFVIYAKPDGRVTKDFERKKRIVLACTNCRRGKTKVRHHMRRL